MGPGLATLLANFQVFFLAAFGAIALRERLTWKMAVAIFLAMIGLYLIVGLKWDLLGPDYKKGVILGLLTALSYSAYLLALRKMQSRPDRLTTLANVALISLSTSFIMGFEAHVQGETFAIPDLQTWFALIGYGMAGQVLGWVLISAGIPKLAASHVGLLLLLQPTLAFAWDILFFGRPTVFVEIIGAVLALFAIYLGTTRR